MTDEARGVKTLHPAATERLHEYWVHGEGAAKIGWGTPGDFDRCVLHLSKYIHDAKGYCNLAHKSALGFYPATHAKMEGKHRSDIHMPTREELADHEWLGERMYEDSLHPHAPAGTSTGGQFVIAGNTGKSGKSPAKSAPGKAAPKKTPPAKPSGPMAYDPKTRKGPGYGMKGGDPRVHELQGDLVRLGLASKTDKAFSDGMYGPKTSAAVKKAQRALGMKPDGIATPQLLAKLAATKTLARRFTMLDVCVRSYAFEFEERGDGRTLEGYAAVFNSPAKIRDLGGDFEETILPGAFKRSLATRMPILQWDHGKDPRIGTAPIGSIEALSEDSRGLHVKARLFDHPDVERVRQGIEARAIKGMSFRFGVPDGGDEWPTRDKRNVRDADVHELGPVAFPAYDTTSVTVRSLLAQLDPDEHRSLLRELAAELRLAVDLEDLTGRPDAWSAGGGDPDTTSGQDAASSHIRLRADDDVLRLRGIL